MARITRAAAHLPAEEVKQRMKTASSALYRQRWLIIYTAQVAPRTAAEIAKECGVSKATVHALIATYNRLGIEAVETVGKGGRHHELLTWHQERELLTPFFARAVEGQIATAGEIQRAYEQRVAEASGRRCSDAPHARHAARRHVGFPQRWRSVPRWLAQRRA